MKNPERTLIISDYDDTLFKTDKFLADVLAMTRYMGKSEIADKIESDIQMLRQEKGTSAGYDIDSRIRSIYKSLETEVGKTNGDRLMAGTQAFYEKIVDNENLDLVIQTCGTDLWQQLKYVGTPFEKDQVPFEIFSDKDKINRFISKIALRGNETFVFGDQNDKVYSKLVVIDNDPRYFDGFDRLAGLDISSVRGYLVHQNNPRFMNKPVPNSRVQTLVSLDDIEL